MQPAQAAQAPPAKVVQEPPAKVVQEPPASADAEGEHMHGRPEVETVSSMTESHAHLGPHFRWTTLRPANQVDQATAWDILRQLRQALAPYREYRAAVNAGFEPFLPNVPQPHYHFTARGMASRPHSASIPDSRPRCSTAEPLTAVTNSKGRCSRRRSGRAKRS
jgi:hypothetical protein